MIDNQCSFNKLSTQLASPDYIRDDNFQWLNMLVGADLLAQQRKQELELAVRNMETASSEGQSVDAADFALPSTIAQSSLYSDLSESLERLTSSDTQEFPDVLMAELPTVGPDMLGEAASVAPKNASSSNIFGLAQVDAASVEQVLEASSLAAGFDVLPAAPIVSAMPMDRDYSAELDAKLDEGFERLDQGLYGDFRDATYDVYNGLEDGVKEQTGSMVDQLDNAGVPLVKDVAEPLSSIEYVDTISALPSAITSEVRSAIGDINDVRSDFLTA